MVCQTLHAADTHEAIENAFLALLAECDLVLTVGGVSVGEKDLVKPVLELLGGTLDLWRVCMKPGKPVALAKVRNKPVVCLPGNPVSAFVVFGLLVSPWYDGFRDVPTCSPDLLRTLAHQQIVS
ncbi:molybdopterin-binding protein [Neopusillimonas aromaticivorans]|nr:molybdopterin-binding protein [Neopusillimonas aromaticivorans]WJJ92911.1 molybdopterin-binding protein [Neopusillimonas aromaticivorans]